jgi:hypothetical protein
VSARCVLEGLVNKRCLFTNDVGTTDFIIV